ncbi:SDR family oxidoreductase [Brevundimonas sp.]|uniref:SDR family NAD(P)-dependent oxidoreductase n=1 Tax=Brevundimonas sp. TaxID=1871086 RepID=UPI0025DDCF85|nr:SDR family oxidoreductase [Brevundimonas sp.]
MPDYARYPSLEGRSVFITGGSSGIGACMVAEYARQGAKVAFVGLDVAAGEKVEAGAPGSWFKRCDVTDAPALEATLAAAAERHGPVTILVNNVANDTRHKAAETTLEQWHRGLAVNLDPAFICSRAVYPGMVEAGGGAILNISSINALLGPAEMPTYVAAKGAINALTKALAREWGPQKIRVNTVSPGWIVTERQLALWLTPEAEAEWMEQVALKERILPEDVARLCLFLSADDSRMITGQNFVIDGGRT